MSLLLLTPTHPTHLATETLLLSGHVFGTASQHTCTMKSRRELKRIGFNVIFWGAM